MAIKQSKSIGEILKEEGFIGEEELLEAQKKEKESGEKLEKLLLDSGLVTEDNLLTARGIQSGMEVVKLDDHELRKEVIKKMSAPIARIYKIMPIKWENNTLTVAMADPSNIRVLDDLHFVLSCELKGAVCSEEEIDRALSKYYGADVESVGDLLEQIEEEMAAPAVEEREEEEEEVDIAALTKLAQDAPVVKLLNLILATAIRDRATDIHFEPFEDIFKVRYRVDGVLYEMVPPPKHLSLALISRIKVMSNLNIAERRLPQDGRIQVTVGGNPVDIRVSTLPTVFGESVVMRVLDRSRVMLELEQLGLLPKDMEIIDQLVKKPNGIILATGPTGCGKTTTLYACLKKVNTPDLKLITTEDPVEYNITGIIQVQIKESIGLKFDLCLRHILRQDPDIILVGEVRDLPTAEMAVQASLTGHLVFSSLHTNDAPGTITRLIDMNVEPFLLTSTVEAIIAQRLVRTICQRCKEPYQPEREELAKLDLTPEQVADRTFYHGAGCGVCNNHGYLGMTGIFEILVMNDALRSLIIDKVPTKDLRAQAVESGMRTLRDDGLEKIYQGITTIKEVAHETQLFE